jgi:putative endonuclease
MHGTFYIGVTNDLIRRVSEHRLGVVSGFTEKHGVHRLVWYEVHSDVREAIRREKRLKKWRRDWKVQLIEQDNPQWMDLFPVIAGAAESGSPGQAG